MEFKNIYQELIHFSKKRDNLFQKIYEQRRLRYICIITFLLITIGIGNMYSTTIFMNLTKDDTYTENAVFSYMKHMKIAFIPAMIAFFLKYKFLNNKKIYRYLLPLAVISLVVIRIGHSFNDKIFRKINGAYGWIRIPGVGFNIQPSELIKILFIMYLAFSLSVTIKKKESNNLKILIANSIVPFLIMSAVVYQKDVGTAIHYFSIYLFMLFMSDIKEKFFKIFGIMSVLFGSLASYIIYNMDLTGSKDHMKPRIQSWISGLLTGEYDAKFGFQVGQGLKGLGSGGITGRGIGEGIFKYEYIPEIHTDFVIASYGEENGLLGIIILIFLFYALFNQSMKVAENCHDFFGKYLVFGLSALIYSQFLINISVAIGLLPVFGIPMPFLSYGGTSLMTILTAIALILNVNMNSSKKNSST